MALLTVAPELDPPTSRYELSWDAPAQCPSVEQVRARVDELLVVAPAEGEAIAAEVQVVASEAGFVASLRLRSGEREGLRELGDPDCRELAEALALIIALAVDPELMSREPVDEEPEPITAEQPEPIDEQPDPVDEQPDPKEEEPDPIEDAPRPEPPSTTRLRGFGLALRGGAAFAIIAPASARVQLSGSSFGRWWRAELGVSTSIPQPIDIGRFSITAAELRGCFVPERRAVEFPLCVGVEAGAMTGVGREGGGRRATAPWLAASPGVGVSWVLLQDRLALDLRADALLPIVRPAFASDEGRLLLRAGFGAQVLAGLEVRFGGSSAVTGRRSLRTWEGR
jgi:hypothetical protein